MQFFYNLFFPFFTLLSEAYDPLDPNGNITIKWDIMSWTADGYVVSLALFVLPITCRSLCVQKGQKLDSFAIQKGASIHEGINLE